MSNLTQIVDQTGYTQTKQFLLEKWGEAADDFPGPFHVWLANWIADVIEEGEDSDFKQDLKMASCILVDELADIEEANNSTLQIKKMSFSEKDPKFIAAIARKYELSTNEIHKLSVQDSKQSLNAINKKIDDAAKCGTDIKLFVSKKTGPIFAAFTNENLDTFGFCKVLYKGNPVMQTFGNKNTKLF
jgi:hypothetical protein